MRLFQSIIPASVLMALLTACGGGESNVESGNRDGFLHYGNGADLRVSTLMWSQGSREPHHPRLV